MRPISPRHLPLRLALAAAGGTALGVVGVAACLHAARPPASRFTDAMYERVRTGMSLEDVRAGLGPPGFHNVPPGEKFVNVLCEGTIAHDHALYDPDASGSAVLTPRPRRAGLPAVQVWCWADAAGGVFVVAEDGRVVGKLRIETLTAFDRRHPPPTFVGRVVSNARDLLRALAARL